MTRRHVPTTIGGKILWAVFVSGVRYHPRHSLSVTTYVLLPKCPDAARST
jgi:hypothetical protein